jgi:hypothetical protein
VEDEGMGLLSNVFNKVAVAVAAVAVSTVLSSTAIASDDFRIDEASWDDEKNRLQVKGKGDKYKTVTVTNADTGEFIADKFIRDDEWRIRVYDLTSIPCRVRAEQSNGETDEKKVKNAPSDCDDGGGTPPGGGDFPVQKDLKIMMNYELGMHCTGFEFAYCCVLPAYNSILAQVVKPESASGTFPTLMSGDPNVGKDALGRQTVLRDKELDSSGNFKKYVLRYWHDAQPRNDGRGKAQTSTLISAVEGNSLLSWNTTFDSAEVVNGALQYGSYNGADGVMLGDGDFDDPTDNYQNAVWNHLYFYADLEGSNPGNSTLEQDKIRLGVSGQPGPFPAVAYPDDCGPAFHPMGPVTTDPNDPTNTVANDCGGFSNGNVLTFSGHTGTVVYTQMKVLENLPVMLTSPDIWEALGLPLTPFEDSIDFFTDPGLVDEDSVRPYVAMKAQLYKFDGVNNDVAVIGSNGEPVIGFGTAPIDIPNCERCHSNPPNGTEIPNSAAEGGGTLIVENSPNETGSLQWARVQQEYNFWNAYYNIDKAAGDSDWYSRLKSAAIGMLTGHDEEHGTSFTNNYPGADVAGELPQNTRLGNESVICQRCHADNVIAAVKSATHGGDVIPPITEAIHGNHRPLSAGGPIAFSDSLGRDGGCQGCHPAHRSDGDMNGYPITLAGTNKYAGGDNRAANGGCFVGRDVHSNPGKDSDGAETPEHLNAVGEWLSDNVHSDPGSSGDLGIWCTNCHTQLSQEIWKAENMEDLVHGVGQNNVRDKSLQGIADEVAGGDLEQVIAWLDPTSTNPKGDFTYSIWDADPGLCDYIDNVVVGGQPASTAHDANVATIEAHVGGTCSSGYVDGPNIATAFGCSTPATLCGTFDGDGDFSVHILDFCTTDDCVADANAGLTGSSFAVPVPFSAATDGRDHWLSAGEPHCADCHAAPYVEQSGNINDFPPFNYPRKASLMRYSRGHQDISCQGCHESIHGLYPVTPLIDTTSYAQAASLNHDGSHGPLKCGTCHEVGNDGIPDWVRDLQYNGRDVKDSFDDAVSWMHTYTVEADPRQDVCLNCHDDESDEVSWHEESWLKHTDKGRTSRQTMDTVEILQQGFVSGDPAVQNPLDTVCQGCHGDESDEVACNDEDWKEHLIEGRVADKVWAYVSESLTGSSCGW